MRIKNVTEAQMWSALSIANQKYSDNIMFNRFDRNPRCFDFTLRVKSSRGPGARVSHSGRRITAACWHAHRDVMVEIFNLAPDAVIKSSFATYKGKEGFYRDYPATGMKNIGSMMQPLTFCSACGC